MVCGGVLRALPLRSRVESPGSVWFLGILRFEYSSFFSLFRKKKVSASFVIVNFFIIVVFFLQK